MHKVDLRTLYLRGRQPKENFDRIPRIFEDREYIPRRLEESISNYLRRCHRELEPLSYRGLQRNDCNRVRDYFARAFRGLHSVTEKKDPDPSQRLKVARRNFSDGYKLLQTMSRRETSRR